MSFENRSALIELCLIVLVLCTCACAYICTLCLCICSICIFKRPLLTGSACQRCQRMPTLHAVPPPPWEPPGRPCPTELQGPRWAARRWGEPCPGGRIAHAERFEDEDEDRHRTTKSEKQKPNQNSKKEKDKEKQKEKKKKKEGDRRRTTENTKTIKRRVQPRPLWRSPPEKLAQLTAKTQTQWAQFVCCVPYNIM